MATITSRTSSFVSRIISPRLLVSNPITSFLPQRWISVTPVHCVKKIEEKVVGDVTVIEGVYVDHISDKFVLKKKNANSCCLCELNLPLHYSDVLIINQFLRPGKGTVLPARITGICFQHQLEIDKLAYQAGKAGLLKGVFKKSLGTKTIMKKKPGHNLQRYYE